MRKRNDAFASDLLSTHPGDQANTRYRAPLDDPDEETLAQFMASPVYSALVEYFTHQTTREQADRVWEQCLVGRRWMTGDADYAAMSMDGATIRPRWSDCGSALRHPLSTTPRVSIAR